MTEGLRSDHPYRLETLDHHGRVADAPRPLQEGEVQLPTLKRTLLRMLRRRADLRRRHLAMIP